MRIPHRHRGADVVGHGGVGAPQSIRRAIIILFGTGLTARAHSAVTCPARAELATPQPPGSETFTQVRLRPLVLGGAGICRALA